MKRIDINENQKVKPIKPRHIGCLHCSPVPDKVMNSTTVPKPAWGFIRIVKQETVMFATEDKQKRTARQLGKEYEIENGETFMHIDSPLHEEVYQWDKVRKRWVLIGQGMGFA